MEAGWRVGGVNDGIVVLASCIATLGSCFVVVGKAWEFRDVNRFRNL